MVYFSAAYIEIVEPMQAEAVHDAGLCRLAGPELLRALPTTLEEKTTATE